MNSFKKINNITFLLAVSFFFTACSNDTPNNSDKERQQEEKRTMIIESIIGIGKILEAFQKFWLTSQPTKDRLGDFAFVCNTCDLATKHLNKKELQKNIEDGFYSQQTINVIRSSAAMILICATAFQAVIRIIQAHKQSAPGMIS